MTRPEPKVSEPALRKNRSSLPSVELEATGASTAGTKAIFAPGGNLTRRHRSARSISQAKDHRAEIFSINSGLNVVFGAKRFAGECFDRMLRLLARLVKCLEISTE